MHVPGGAILGYTKLHARVGTSCMPGWAAANRGAHADAEQHETASEGLRAVRARVQVAVAHCGAARGETAIIIGTYGSVSGAAASCWFALQEDMGQWSCLCLAGMHMALCAGGRTRCERDDTKVRGIDGRGSAVAKMQLRGARQCEPDCAYRLTDSHCSALGLLSTQQHDVNV